MTIQISIDTKNELKRQCAEMLQQGIIRYSTTTFHLRSS
jgi:hypothetical protein